MGWGLRRYTWWMLTEGAWEDRGAGSKLGVGGLIQAQAQDNTVIHLIVMQPWPSVKPRSLEGPFYFHLNLGFSLEFSY